MTHEVSGVIEPGNLYLADEVRRRLQLGDWAWRQVRRQGLRVTRQGRNAYVLGDDLIAFFRDKSGRANDVPGADQKCSSPDAGRNGYAQ